MRWAVAGIVLVALLLLAWAFGDRERVRRSERPERSGRAMTRNGPADAGEPAGVQPGEARSVLRLACLDHERRPLPGLVVMFGVGSWRAVGRFAPFTDAGGRTTIACRHAPGTKLSLVVFHPILHGADHRAQAATTHPRGDERTRLVFGRRVERTVRVVDDHDRAIPGATVDVDPAVHSDGWHIATEGGFTLRTGSAGECRILVTERNLYRIEVRADGFQERSDWGWRAPTLPHAATVFRLERGFLVRGVLLDPDGAPLAGARVVLRGRVNHRTMSGDEGAFEFDGLDARKYRLETVDADGVLRDRRTLEIKGETDLGRIGVHPVTEVEGRVLDAGRRPVADATVHVKPGDQRTRTGEDGRFSMRTSLLDGTWLVVAHEEAGHRWLRAGAWTSPIVLETPGDVHVRLAAPDGAGLGLVRVEYGPPGRPPLQRLVPAGPRGQLLVRLRGMPPGPLEIRVSPRRKRLEVESGRTARTNFQLPR